MERTQKIWKVTCTFQKHLKNYWYCTAKWREKVHIHKWFEMKDFTLEWSTAWNSWKQYKELPTFKSFEEVFELFMIDVEDKYRHLFWEKV